MLFIEQFHSSPFKEGKEIEQFVYNQFISSKTTNTKMLWP